MKLMPRRDAKHWYELLTRAYADYFENETAKNVAVGCDGKEGSTVRVRQRALQSPSKSGVSHRTLYRANKVLLLGFPHEDLQSQRRRVGSHGRARGLALQGRLGRRAHRRRADRREHVRGRAG